jgi:enamine deaminase RidA (YjgF/YER057c/UK114 family)
MKIERINPSARFSQAVVCNNTIYISGQVAADASADAKGQTEQILKQIEQLLVQSGSNKSMILWTCIWLADMGDYGDMNTVWETWIPSSQMPARATVEAKLASPSYKVEIACIAACISDSK